MKANTSMPTCIAPEGFGLGKDPTDSRLLKSLKPFTLKPPSLGLFAPFLRSNLRLPVDHHSR